MSVTVYGASDDLVEIDGDIHEEFNYYDRDGETKHVLAFSDGTLARIAYTDDGTWRITRLAQGSANWVKVEADGGDSDNYSDRVTLEGDIRWVVMGSQYEIAKRK